MKENRENEQGHLTVVKKELNVSGRMWTLEEQTSVGTLTHLTSDQSARNFKPPYLQNGDHNSFIMKLQWTTEREVLTHLMQGRHGIATQEVMAILSINIRIQMILKSTLS